MHIGSWYDMSYYFNPAACPETIVIYSNDAGAAIATVMIMSFFIFTVFGVSLGVLGKAGIIWILERLV